MKEEEEGRKRRRKDRGGEVNDVKDIIIIIIGGTCDAWAHRSTQTNTDNVRLALPPATFVWLFC